MSNLTLPSVKDLALLFLQEFVQFSKDLFPTLVMFLKLGVNGTA